MINKLSFIFSSCIASQYITVSHIFLQVIRCFSTISCHCRIIFRIDKFTIINHDFAKSYKTSIIVRCKENTHKLSSYRLIQNTFNITISWVCRIMCPAVGQGIITNFIFHTISDCYNICPVLTIFTDLYLPITQIITLGILNISTNLLDLTSGAKFHDNFPVFTFIIGKFYKIIKFPIKHLT